MNRFEYIVSVFVMGIAFIQCDKEPTPRANSFETPIVTGFDFKDENNNSLGCLGIPNDNIKGEPCQSIKSAKMGIVNNASKNMLSACPNPCNDLLSIYIRGGSSSCKIWIVKALYTGAKLPGELSLALNSNTLGTNSTLAGGAPIFYAEQNGSQNLNINMKEFAPGCYRVYVDICGNLLWYNFLKMN